MCTIVTVAWKHHCIYIYFEYRVLDIRLSNWCCSVSMV